jgi:Kelch motif/Galactose oxidase, central domain
MVAALRRVLVAGLLIGLASTGPIPAQAKAADSGAWTQAPNLLEGHVAHTATLLNDGRVLIAGGTDVDGVARARCELFDPRTNRWTRAADMIHARAAHAATLLAEGNVLVTGGQTGLGIFPNEVLASAEIYHPASNSWTVVAPMHAPRRWHTSIRLHDGRVLVVGGTNVAPGSPLPAAEQEQAEVYDPKRDSWSLAGAGLPPLSGQVATLMPGGAVLVTGGSTETGFATTGAELFDPATNRWQPTTWPMATARYGHTATLLPDGKVLLLGGYSTQPQPSGGFVYPESELLTTSEIFDLRGNILVRVGYSRIPRLDHTATLLRTGKVLVVGSAYASDADSQLFDPANTPDWVSTGLRMDRYLHTATLLADGRVLIAGGYGLGSPTTTWIFSAVPGMSAPSGFPPALLASAAGILLVLLTVIGLIATSGRLSRRRAATIREDDSKWIDS